MLGLLIADIHIKIGQKNVPKPWAINRYRMFLDQVAEVEKGVELIVVPGDIFDRMPTLAEQDIYWDFVVERKVKTIISTGNHEATKKGKSFFTELKKVTERLNPLVTVVVDELYSTDEFHVVPYEFIKDKSVWENLSPLPVFTHVRGEIPPHVKPEIDLSWLDKFPVVFAGDLHSHSNTQRNIVYPGSPMTTSFHRSEVSTGYIIFDTKTWEWYWKSFDLPQLIRKTVSSPEEMIPTDFHHTIYELEGNIQELSKIENSELLDKKLVRRSSDTALVLKTGMSIQEELKEYLLYIQELSESQVEKIMETFYEYGSTKITSME